MLLSNEFIELQFEVQKSKPINYSIMILPGTAFYSKVQILFEKLNYNHHLWIKAFKNI